MSSITRVRALPLPELLLLLTALIWGGGFIFTNLAILSGLPLSLILTLRFSIPTIIMAVLFRQEMAIASRSDLLCGAGAGVILFLAFFLQTYGIKYTTPANSAFLTATNVIMVPFISWLLFRQKPARCAFPLAFTCFVGAAVLSWTPGAGMSFNPGDCLTLLCAFLFACHIAFLGAVSGITSSAAVLSVVQLGVSALLSMIAFCVIDQARCTLKAFCSGILPMLYLAILSTGLCYFLQNWAQRRVAPAKAAILLSCEGLFGSLLSVICGYDELTPTFVAGGAIILLSVILAQIDWSHFGRTRGESSAASSIES